MVYLVVISILNRFYYRLNQLELLSPVRLAKLRTQFYT